MPECVDKYLEQVGAKDSPRRVPDDPDKLGCRMAAPGDPRHQRGLWKRRERARCRNGRATSWYQVRR